MIQRYKSHDLKRFLHLRGIKIEGKSLPNIDMAKMLKDHDLKLSMKEKNDDTNAKFDKPGKSQRAKSLEALKSRGVKG